VDYFISNPNKCDGCPLNQEDNYYKVINRCDLVDDRYEVNYLLDDLGRTICEVKQKKIEA